MKIVEGRFPWRLLYLPLVVAAAAGLLYVIITDSWQQPIGPTLFLFSSGYCAWWAYLTIRSGVAIGSRPELTPDRESTPILFWFVALLPIAMALIFLFISASMLGWIQAGPDFHPARLLFARASISA
ncbi:hypothetical protein [Peristeroidobacter soli]|jgi:hypothetical protein|uniref:hypothetical protein n=1 Tax=Peristeroidobacter soli TaxID=2497877 RepID=UPI00101C1CC8|nr:hypothetical protein [Peristeroidobacter soli]